VVKIRVGVVCGDPLRVEGLRAVLEQTCDLIELTAPGTLREVDLPMVLIDTPEENLFNMMAAFRRARPGLRLIVLGSRTDSAFIQKVVAGGSKGYLLYTAGPKEIQMAVEVVADGSIWAPRRVLSSLIDTYAPAEPRLPEIRLTPREREVTELLIAGRANREIASTLGVETKTVKSHVGRLLQKFNVPNRVALTVRALEMQVREKSQPR